MPSLASTLRTPPMGTFQQDPITSHSGALPARFNQPSSLFHPPPAPIIPGVNPFLRCPLPIVTGGSPDNLRQFYKEGILKSRIFGV